MKTSFLAKYIAAILGVFILFGCAKKPPECADPAASETMHRVMNEQITKALPYVGVVVKDDTRGVIPQYLATWGFSLSNIATTGYDETSHLRSCKAKAAVTIPGYEQGSGLETTFTLQVFEDSKDGAFELKAAPNFVAWAQGAAAVVKPYYAVNRISGTWSGTSTCGPTKVTFSGADDSSPQVPDGERGYTLVSTQSAWAADAQDNTYPVSMSIKSGSVTMLMTKPDASKLTRAGKLDAYGKVVMQNSDELATLVPSQGYFDRADKFAIAAPNWIGVEAQVKSNATGKEFRAQLQRACEFKLAKTS